MHRNTDALNFYSGERTLSLNPDPKRKRKSDWTPMELDWDFFYDSWLIDRIPDSLEIKIEEHPTGLYINPPSLTCYFGANPIYLYGLGKLLHEVIMSPTGIVVYPSFLHRPGFEFIEEITFSASFEEETDFSGNVVIDKHIGMVNAKKYLEGILYNIYGARPEYVGVQTPSSDLRELGSSDYLLQGKGIAEYQIYQDVQEMSSDGCTFFCRMGSRNKDYRLVDEINGTLIDIVSPGAVVQTSGTYGSVVFLRYSYVLLPSYLRETLLLPQFQIFFSTMIGFRPGVIIDIGSTFYPDSSNYGFRLEVLTTGITVTANDGEIRTFPLLFGFDFAVANRVLITRNGDNFMLSVNGGMESSHSIPGAGNIVFGSDQNNMLSYDIEKGRNSPAGDIENLAFYSPTICQENMDKYSGDPIPFLSEGTPSVEYEHIPVSLSYDLTYQSPARLNISNFFGGDINRIYMVNLSNEINTAEDRGEIKSFSIPEGFKIDTVSTNNLVEYVDFTIGEKIPVLTKLTSDTHIPLKIYMKFKVPDFWEKNNTYNISLVIRSVEKFLRYTYRKYKTGEFL